MKFCRNMYLDNRSRILRILRSTSQDRIFGFFTIACYSKKFVTTITHEPLHSACWNFSRTYTSVTSRVLLRLKVIGQRSRSFLLVDRSSPNCFHRTWDKSELIMPFSAYRLLDQFQRHSRSKSKSFSKFSALLITHKPLHLAWWNYPRTCTSTTFRTPLNFEVIGQRSRSNGFWCFSVCVILRLPADST